MFNSTISLSYNSCNVEWLQGNCLTLLKTLPNESIQCCVTSPPYFNLRDYDNIDQIGIEKTPEDFVKKLTEIFTEVRRVLKNDGILWLNIGDTWAKSKFDKIKPKDLMGIPWQLAFALRDSGWYLRQDIIWSKTNPMPESVKNRCTASHEYVFLFAKQEQYYYDSKAIAVPADPTTWGIPKDGNYTGKDRKDYVKAKVQQPSGIKRRLAAKLLSGETITRNAHSVWRITKASYSGAHFAVMPKILAEQCILAGSKKGDWILDPFGGAGTTALAALTNERNCLLLELNSEYIETAKNRLLVEFSKNGIIEPDMTEVDELFDFKKKI